MINVKVKANVSENSVNLLKRFNKRVQSSGVLVKAKSSRFKTRKSSPFVKKKNKLRSIAKRQKVEKMLKMGQIVKKGRK